MRIAQITPRYFPHIGGVEMVVKNLSEEMTASGHQVDVLTIESNIQHAITEVINGVTIKRFPLTGVFYHSLPLARFLNRQCHQYDIVHVHNLHTFLPGLTVKALERTNRKGLVISGHYHGRGKTYLSNFLLKLYRPHIKKLLSATSKFICVSKFEANLIRSHFEIPEEKLHVIPNGVAVDEIAMQEPHPKGINKNILIVSRLEKYKNIQLAIRAMHFLPDHYNLNVIGEGPYRKNLEKICNALNLQDRVRFLGKLTNEEVYRWYKTSDLTINLSALEAFGLTVVESLAAGTPVLVSDGTALSELAKRFNEVTAVDINKIKDRQLAGVIKSKVICDDHVTSALDSFRWKMIVKQVLKTYEGV